MWRFILKVRELVSQGIREAARADMLAGGIYRPKEPCTPGGPVPDLVDHLDRG